MFVPVCPVNLGKALVFHIALSPLVSLSEQDVDVLTPFASQEYGEDPVVNTTIGLSRSSIPLHGMSITIMGEDRDYAKAHYCGAHTLH